VCWLLKLKELGYFSALYRSPQSEWYIKSYFRSIGSLLETLLIAPLDGLAHTSYTVYATESIAHTSDVLAGTDVQLILQLGHL